MNDEEAIRLYSALVDILHQHKLGWVADHVAEDVRLGRLRPKKVPTREEIPSALAEPPRFKRGKSERHLSVIPYTAEEKLYLLIDAIRQAVVSTARMEEEIADVLAEDRVFEMTYSGPDLEDRRPVSREAAALRAEKVAHIEALLAELATGVKPLAD